MSELSVFDDRRCQLGEGPLWHPGRQQLFWFDILQQQLLSRLAGRVERYNPDGKELQVVAVPTPQTTCPALGGENLDLLYITTAARGIEAGDGSAGRLFQVPVGIRGQAEHRVVLATG